MIELTRRGLRRLANGVAARLGEHDIALLAAGLTFYAAIAVVPLLLVAVFLVSAIAGHEVVLRLAGQLARYAPQPLGFRQQLLALVAAGADLSPLAVVAALIAATTYGEGLVRAFDRLAGANRRAKGLRGRLLALWLLGVLPLLVLGGLGAVAVLPGLLGVGRGAQLLGVYLTFWVAWLAATGLLAVTYRAFSPARAGWGPVLWGAAAAGSSLAGMSLGWVLVLHFGIEVGRAYGGSEAIGAVVLFAVYLFLVQIVCLVGYALTLELARRR